MSVQFKWNLSPLIERLGHPTPYYVVIRARFIGERHKKLGCSFHKKHTETCYAELVLLHQVGYVGHVVNSCASGPQNIDALFSCSGGLGAVSIKSTPGQVTPNLCFCIQWDLLVTQCIPVHPGRETSTHYFSCSGGTGTDSIKSTPGHVTLNLCFCILWDMHVT
jgi:hypothetical protein